MNVICYIDGFNLYHGLRSKRWKKYYWLDLWKLAERFLRSGQTLSEVVYCTTKIKDDPDGQQRQLNFIDALQAHRPGIKLIYGHYLAKSMTCHKCHNGYIRHEEKMTDVNIACQMLVDAMDGRFDVALLISGDSDLVPPVKIIRNRWPGKRVVALLPPNRHSAALEHAVHGVKRISEADLRQSLLPQQVKIITGKYLTRPKTWS